MVNTTKNGIIVVVPIGNRIGDRGIDKLTATLYSFMRLMFDNRFYCIVGISSCIKKCWIPTFIGSSVAILVTRKPKNDRVNSQLKAFLLISTLRMGCTSSIVAATFCQTENRTKTVGYFCLVFYYLG